ncbi:MAG TPA: PIN domain-containing protein [Opitutales bacterium]|nr:PIN domain-containing protein [Opitutales bacterium]
MAGDLILDTSAAVAHLRGIATVTAQMQACLAAGRTLYLPLTAWGELLYGVYRSDHPERELAILLEFARGMVRLYPTDETADVYAKIKRALAMAGSPIPENDIWIAAFAIERNLPLAARDEHFLRISGLTLLDWR